MISIPATQKTMSSREIAELTQSTHDNVLKSIRHLAEKGLVFPNETTYKHPQNNQLYPELNISFRDTMLVVSGYSVELRARIIDRWQELESADQYKIPQTLPEALRLAADLADKVEQQQLQLEQQQPAVEFLDRFVEAKSNKNFREVSKILGLKEREFIQSLIDENIIFRQSGNLLPFAHYQHAGWFTVKTGEANGRAIVQTRFTPAGIAWVAKRYCVIA